MLFLIAILVAGLFSWFCAGALKKHPGIFYALGSILTVVMIVLGQMHLSIQNQPVMRYLIDLIDLFNKGALACALWCVVAYMGALPNGSTAIRKLMPIRGELSIFSASITISHAVTYGIVYLQRLLRNSGADFNFIATCIVCVLLLVIMIPLTILSFKKIRKKMNPRTWKKIQRSAYLFYALIYLHVMLIYVPRARTGREGSMLSILLYTAIFAGYAVLRIRKAVIRQKKPESKAMLNTICTASVVLVIAGSGMISRATEQKTVTTEAPSAPETTAVTESLTETSPETEATVADPAETTAPEPESKSTESKESSESPESENAESQESANPTEASDSEESANTENPEPETTAVTATEVMTNPSENPENHENPDNPENPEPEQNQDFNPEPDPDPMQENPNPDPEPEPEPQPEPEPEPEIVSIYNNGTFTSEQFGYDSPVTVSITIQDDVIIDVTASCNESDMYYFEEAYPVLKNRILEAQSADGIDAVSGSTYSSNAILNGVRSALESARK